MDIIAIPKEQLINVSTYFSWKARGDTDLGSFNLVQCRNDYMHVPPSATQQTFSLFTPHQLSVTPIVWLYVPCDLFIILSVCRINYYTTTYTTTAINSCNVMKLFTFVNGWSKFRLIEETLLQTENWFLCQIVVALKLK